MNILIIHSTQSLIIKNIIKTLYQNENVFVMTFARNKGTFLDCAKETYFSSESYKIISYDVIGDIENFIKEQNIDLLVGVYGNINGNTYENLRVIFSSIHNCKKVIYNKEFKEVVFNERENDSLIEFFNKNEKDMLPLIVEKLLKYRLQYKPKVKDIKNIMFVFDTCSINGTTNLLYNWAKKIKEKYNVVCVFENDGPMLKDFLQTNIKTYICNKENYDETATMNFYFSLNSILIKESPEVIIIAGNNTIVPCTASAVKNRIPFILKMNNAEFLDIMDSRLTLFELKQMAPLYDNFIAISKYVGNNIISIIGNDGKIKLLYGTNIDLKDSKYNKISKCEDLPNNKINITCVSRLSSEKGVDIFLKSISNINMSVLHKCNFNIVGDGTEKDKLFLLAKDLKIDKFVNFMGYRKNVLDIINASYLTVTPSRREGLGLTILETMSLAKTCIASNVGGIPEIIENKVNGLIFESEDDIALARLIEECIDNPQLVKEMEKNAFDTVNEKFNINIIMKEFYNMIEGFKNLL